MITQLEFIKILFISAAVGGLVGIEREMKVETVAGTRTFILVSILGALTVLVSEIISGYLVSIVMFGVVLYTILTGIIKNYKLNDIGLTTPIALLVTFILGLMVGKGHFLEGVAGSVFITAILTTKNYSKHFSEALTYKEIISAMQFGLIAFVLYPIMPDAPIDPFGIINPKLLTFVTIVASLIGFLGYLAIQTIGSMRGLAVVGALGGLLNSEATASILSSRVKEKPDMAESALNGMMLANVVMMVRNLVIAGVVSTAVLKGMIIPQLAMVAAGLVYIHFMGKRDAVKVKLSFPMPFAVQPAAVFAAIFVLVSWGVTYLKDIGALGIYLAALLGGLISSAATTASFSSLYVLGSIDASSAAVACVLSAVGSTFSKIAISRLLGTQALFMRVVRPMLLFIVVGVAAIYFFTGA